MRFQVSLFPSHLILTASPLASFDLCSLCTKVKILIFLSFSSGPYVNSIPAIYRECRFLVDSLQLMCSHKYSNLIPLTFLFLFLTSQWKKILFLFKPNVFMSLLNQNFFFYVFTESKFSLLLQRPSYVYLIYSPKNNFHFCIFIFSLKAFTNFT